MKKGCYTVVAQKLQALLDAAGKPGADYQDIGRQVRTVDYAMQFPDHLPVSYAKDAGLRCLGPRVYSKHHADALHKISSCEIADNQYFES